MSNEDIREVNLSQFVPLWNTKLFHRLSVGLGVLLFLTEVANILTMHHNMTIGMLFTMDFIQVFFELCRAIFTLILILSLTKALMTPRKQYRGEGLRGLQAVIGMASAFLFLLSLVFASPLFHYLPIPTISVYIAFFATYFFLAIRYVSRLRKYFMGVIPTLPSPVFVLLLLSFVTVSLILLYYLVQFGATLGVGGRVYLYFLDVPFYLYLLNVPMFLILISMIFMVHQPWKTKKQFVWGKRIIATIAIVFVASVGIIEISTPHYWLQVEENNSNLILDMNFFVHSRGETIEPIRLIQNCSEFPICVDEGYFSQAVEDFGLVEHVDSIPRTSSSLMTTIEFTDTISLTTLRVFDESGHLYLANQNWSRLDHLPEGTYYIVFDVVNHVNVQYLFAQYVFILEVQ